MGFYIGESNIILRLLFYDFLLLFVPGDTLSWENLSMNIIAAVVSRLIHSPFFLSRLIVIGGVDAIENCHVEYIQMFIL